MPTTSTSSLANKYTSAIASSTPVSTSTNTGSGAPGPSPPTVTSPTIGLSTYQCTTGQLRREVGADIRQCAHRGVDAHRLLDQSAYHHGRGVLGADGRHGIESTRRRDHRRLHQGHMNGGEGDVVGQRLGGYHFGERIQCSLGWQIRAVLGAARLHAGAGYVHDVSEPALTPVRQQGEHHAHRAEVVHRHHPLVVVEAV